MAEIYKRSITGVSIILVITLSILYGPYSFGLLCFIIGMLAVYEFYRLFGVTNKTYLTLSGLLLSATICITVFLFILHYSDWPIILVNLLVTSFIITSVLFIRSEKIFIDVAFIFLGQVYAILPFILLYECAFALNENIFNAKIIFGYFIFLWANDTGAYVVGSLFGKHLLSPVISPKKTWEGSIGGAGFVIIASFVNFHFFHLLSLKEWIMLGAIVIVMGTLGDLVKSAMKRSKNVKDSGNILPGHGGILDRFDSLIGSVPFVLIFLEILCLD